MNNILLAAGFLNAERYLFKDDVLSLAYSLISKPRPKM